MRQDAKRMWLTAGVMVDLLPLNYVLALLSALNRLQTKPLLQMPIFSQAVFPRNLLKLPFARVLVWSRVVPLAKVTKALFGNRQAEKDKVEKKGRSWIHRKSIRVVFLHRI